MSSSVIPVAFPCHQSKPIPLSSFPVTLTVIFPPACTSVTSVEMLIVGGVNALAKELKISIKNKKLIFFNTLFHLIKNLM